jgi:hypothetical protein
MPDSGTGMRLAALEAGALTRGIGMAFRFGGGRQLERERNSFFSHNESTK